MKAQQMRSETWLIIEIGAILAALCILCFFVTPAYDKGAWFLMGVFASQFGNMIGYSFGRSVPQQIGDPKPGQATKSEVTTTTVNTAAPPPVEVALPPEK